MKTKIITFGHDCWQMLTEIPGWPDAPKKVRIRRALPILIPCGLIFILIGLNKGFRNPYIQRERAIHQTLLDQEKEIDALRLGISEQKAAELSAQSTLINRQILSDPKELTPILSDLKRQAAEKRWEGSFQASDLSTGAPTATTESLVVFLPARAKLTSAAGDSEAFSSLLVLIDQFSASEKRIDLTRLAIRADEQGRYTAELNFRLVARASHEKTPQ